MKTFWKGAHLHHKNTMTVNPNQYCKIMEHVQVPVKAPLAAL